jgi:hypothetical protein
MKFNIDIFFILFCSIFLIVSGVLTFTNIYPYTRGGFYVFPWVGYIELLVGIIFLIYGVQRIKNKSK